MKALDYIGGGGTRPDGQPGDGSPEGDRPGRDDAQQPDQANRGPGGGFRRNG